MKGLRNAGKEGCFVWPQGDNGKGKWILAGACPEQGRMGEDDEEGGAGMTRKDARMTKRE